MIIKKHTIVLYLLLSGFWAISLISRQIDPETPSLALSIVCYLLSFILAVIWKKSSIIVSKKEAQPWDPSNKKNKIMMLFGIFLSLAAKLVFASLSQNLAKNGQSNWPALIWGNFVPFTISLFNRQIISETLVVSGGTPLALTAACILMLPFESFHIGILSNITSIGETICTGLFLIFTQKLLESEVIFKEDLEEIFGKRAWEPSEMSGEEFVAGLAESSEAKETRENEEAKSAAESKIEMKVEPLKPENSEVEESTENKDKTEE
jgi:hypothetical protein